jgi:hypothetical protein
MGERHPLRVVVDNEERKISAVQFPRQRLPDAPVAADDGVFRHVFDVP